MNFDLNVEAMSRDELITAYYDVVDRFEQVFGIEMAELQTAIDFLRANDAGLKYSRTGSAKTLCLLKTGRIISRRAIIAATAMNKAPEDCITVRGGMASVYICYLRKILTPLGVKIITINGLGYQIQPQSLKVLSAALAATTIRQ